jgi:hypothetical protein
MFNRHRHRTPFLPPWLGLVLVWCFAWPWCRAQNVIIHLRNGDRITGSVLLEKTNEVTLSTTFGVSITLPVSQIERRETLFSTSAETARGASSAGSKPPAPAPVPPIAVIPKAAPAPATKPSPALALAKPPVPPFRKFLSEWKGEMDLGLNVAFSAKNRQAYTGRLKLTQAHMIENQHLLKNTLDYISSYGTIDGVLSDNRMDGSWKIEYDVSKRFLIYNAAGAGYDEIRKITAQYDLGPGVGYKWVVRTNFVLATELGGNYQQQFFIDGTAKSRYSLRLAEDSWWQISKKLRFDEKFEFFPELRDFSDYRIRVETNLSYLLRQNLTLKLTVIDLYETASRQGVTHNDLQIRSLHGAEGGEAIVFVQNLDGAEAAGAQQFHLKCERARRILVFDVGENMLTVGGVLQLSQVFAVSLPHQCLHGRNGVLDEIANPKRTTRFERRLDLGKNAPPLPFLAQMVKDGRGQHDVELFAA